jgi:ketosteroid isomerase-like protein
MSQQAQEPEKGQILTLLETWRNEVGGKLNLDYLTEYYHPDIVLFDMLGPTHEVVGVHQVVGVQNVRAVWDMCLPMMPAKFSFEHKDIQITASGTVAFVHFLQRMIPLVDVEKWKDCGDMWCRFTLGCQKMPNGKWCVAHEHSSLPLDMETMKGIQFKA